MKITKKGTIPEDRIWNGKCNNCGAEAEAKESEMSNIQIDQKESGRFSWAKCPVCGKDGNGGMLFRPELELMKKNQ